jgi:hypothetical protein
LDKDSCNIESTLKEANKILKTWWKIISFNNDNDKIIKYLKENNIKFKIENYHIYFELWKTI